jgi:hypothetical protein
MPLSSTGTRSVGRSAGGRLVLRTSARAQWRTSCSRRGLRLRMSLCVDLGFGFQDLREVPAARHCVAPSAGYRLRTSTCSPTATRRWAKGVGTVRVLRSPRMRAEALQTLVCAATFSFTLPSCGSTYCAHPRNRMPSRRDVRYLNYSVIGAYDAAAASSGSESSSAAATATSSRRSALAAAAAAATTWNARVSGAQEYVAAPMVGLGYLA